MINVYAITCVVNSSKNHTNKILDLHSKRTENKIKRIATIMTSEKNNKRREEETTQYLFTQFGPKMTYSGEESNSPFH
jgi:hypothetical protein